MTNREFAEKDSGFRTACLIAGEKLINCPGYIVSRLPSPDPKAIGDPIILPTKRQASKFRRNYGSAYNFSR